MFLSHTLGKGFRFPGIERLVAAAFFLALPGMSVAAPNKEAPYLGNWSGNKGWALTITPDTISFESQGNPDAKMKYQDVTPEGDTVYHLEIPRPVADSLFSYKYVSVTMNASSKQNEMTVKFFESASDLKAGASEQYSGDWIRDGAVSAAAEVSAEKKTEVTLGADALVKELFAAHQSRKGTPFFQTTDRSPVDRYFTKDLGDLIWKDAVDSKGEVGGLSFDPLYQTQDPQITKLDVKKPEVTSDPQFAFITANFKDWGRSRKVMFEMMNVEGEGWKVHNVIYSDGENMKSLLAAALYPGKYPLSTFTGDYLVGKVPCNVSPTSAGLIHRVQFEGEKEMRRFIAGGGPEEVVYTCMEKGQEKAKFVFKSGEASGSYVDAKGKEFKVTPVK